MSYKTRKDGRVYNSKKRQNSGDIYSKDGKLIESKLIELEKKSQEIQRRHLHTTKLSF